MKFNQAGRLIYAYSSESNYRVYENLIRTIIRIENRYVPIIIDRYDPEPLIIRDKLVKEYPANILADYNKWNYPEMK